MQSPACRKPLKDCQRKHWPWTELNTFFARNRSALLNQNVSITQELFKTAPAILSAHLLRNFQAGLGYKHKVIEHQQLSLAANWNSRGFDALVLAFFSWNAGNLQRHCKGDCLNDLSASPWHVVGIQEAEATSVQQALYDSRGIKSISSRDRCIMINAGGSWYKMARKVHEDDTRENENCDWIQRPSTYDERKPIVDAESVM